MVLVSFLCVIVLRFFFFRWCGVCVSQTCSSRFYVFLILPTTRGEMYSVLF